MFKNMLMNELAFEQSKVYGEDSEYEMAIKKILAETAYIYEIYAHNFDINFDIKGKDGKDRTVTIKMGSRKDTKLAVSHLNKNLSIMNSFLSEAYMLEMTGTGDVAQSTGFALQGVPCTKDEVGEENCKCTKCLNATTLMRLTRPTLINF